MRNFYRGNFDGYRLFKYLTKYILMDGHGHCLSLYTCKRCIVFKQFDRLNLDSLAGKRQKRQNFPHQNFVPYSILLCHTLCCVLPLKLIDIL